MLNDISWTNYLTAISILFILYYSFIGIRFYFHELRMIFAFRRNSLARNDSSQNQIVKDEGQGSDAPVSQVSPTSSHEKFMPAAVPHLETSEETNEVTSEGMQDLHSRLTQAIGDAVTNNYLKEEFIFSMSLLLKDYQYLKGSPFSQDINNAIVAECEQYGYVQLSAEELGKLWNE